VADTIHYTEVPPGPPGTKYWFDDIVSAWRICPPEKIEAAEQAGFHVFDVLEIKQCARAFLTSMDLHLPARLEEQGTTELEIEREFRQTALAAIEANPAATEEMVRVQTFAATLHRRAIKRIGAELARRATLNNPNIRRPGTRVTIDFAQEIKRRYLLHEMLVQVLQFPTMAKSTGDGYLMLCPLHNEKTPSCRIHDENFHCFGCGASGDIYDLVQALYQMTWVDAVLYVADRLRVPVPKPVPSPVGSGGF